MVESFTPLAAARREFEEELGVAPSGEFIPLEPVKQAGGKRVFAWAVRGEFDPSQLKSNMFLLEWPPKSGRQQSFPEVDRAQWFGLDEARRRMLEGQRPLLDSLVLVLSRAASGEPT